MDLNGCDMPKILKEKRERQPNWTEQEKQLLWSLTRIHQSVLDNKCSDTMTLKLKSEAWDNIALNMKAAGYNRSKERLKQQLGRLRAAEAKKQKDLLDNDSSKRTNNNDRVPSAAETSKDVQPMNLSVSIVPNDESGICVKSEEEIMSPIEAEDLSITQDERNSEHSVQNDELSTENGSNQKGLSSDIEEIQLTLNKVDVMSNLDKRIDVRPSKLNASSDANDTTVSALNTPKNSRYMTKVRANPPGARRERFDQLHMYRVAVERERLRMLKLQQKRDRVLFLKDLQIQNLKVEILNNIAGHSRGDKPSGEK